MISRSILILVALSSITLFVYGNSDNGVNVIEFTGEYDRIFITSSEDAKEVYVVTGGKAQFMFSPGQSVGYYLVYWERNGQWYKRWIRVVGGTNKVSLAVDGSNYGLARDEVIKENQRHTKNNTITVVVNGNPLEVSASVWGSGKRPKYYAVLASDKDDVSRSERLSKELADREIMLAVVKSSHWRITNERVSVGDCCLYDSSGKLIAKWRNKDDSSLLKEIEERLSGGGGGITGYNSIWMYILIAIALWWIFFKRK